MWARYVLEELDNGWNEVFSEARPARFGLSLGGGEAVQVHASRPREALWRDGSSKQLGELFDDELPDEIAACGESFAARVEAQRLEREALYRVRVERIVEGETVSVVGRASADGRELEVDAETAGSLLANTAESELTRVPALWGLVALALFGSSLFSGGLWCFRMWGHL